MKKDSLMRLVLGLADEYKDTTKVEDGGKTLVKLPTVYFPEGCEPPSTTALVIIDEQQPAPQLYLKVLPKLPNGKVPRSVSTATFAGDSWHGFSFNQSWDENSHTAVQFVEGRLRRFALSE